MLNPVPSTPPLCKCGSPCAYYGKVGGYSVGCLDCNAQNAKRQREARARKHGMIVKVSPSYRYQAAIDDLKARKDHIDKTIQCLEALG